MLLKSSGAAGYFFQFSDFGTICQIKLLIKNIIKLFLYPVISACRLLIVVEFLYAVISACRLLIVVEFFICSNFRLSSFGSC